MTTRYSDLSNLELTALKNDLYALGKEYVWWEWQYWTAGLEQEWRSTKIIVDDIEAQFAELNAEIEYRKSRVHSKLRHALAY